MPYKAHVENGAIIPDEPLDLPDGSLVEVFPVEKPANQHHPDVERFGGVIKPGTAETHSYFAHLGKKHA